MPLEEGTITHILLSRDLPVDQLERNACLLREVESLDNRLGQLLFLEVVRPPPCVALINVCLSVGKAKQKKGGYTHFWQHQADERVEVRPNLSPPVLQDPGLVRTVHIGSQTQPEHAPR